MVDSLNNNSQAAINSAQVSNQNSGISNSQNKVDNSNAIAARLQNNAVKVASDISVARDITDKITLSPRATEIIKSSASENTASSEITVINAAANQNNNVQNDNYNDDDVVVNEIAPVNDTNQVKRDDNRTGVINGNQDSETEAVRSLGKIVDQFA